METAPPRSGARARSNVVRLAVAAVAAFLAVSAATILMLHVDVRGGTGARSCGSAFDVVTGRSGWETWRAQDLADGSTTAARALLRTDRCPDAVDRRIVAAGGLAGAAVILAAIAAFASARGTRETVRVPAHGGGRPALRLRRLGRTVELAGIALTVAGLAAVVLVTADPNATLFLYVDRPVVALIGVVVLLPVIALGIGGRALVLVGQAMERDERESQDA